MESALMMRRSPGWLVAVLAVLSLGLGACVSDEAAAPKTRAQAPTPSGPKVGDYKVGKPYQIAGVWYYPKVDYDYRVTGIASWYGPGFQGRRTANGEIYDQNQLTAAHPTLPMPSVVRVTNLDNGRAIKVRINDRGPFKNGRIIDLSRRGAQLLGFERKGTARVRVEIDEDSSRQHAVFAQNQQLAKGKPQVKAAPTQQVTAQALPPLGAGNTQAAPAQAKTPSPAPKQRFTELPWPDETVSRTPVTAASRIFIQAGSFLRRDYATRLRAKLSRLARANVVAVQVGQQRFFRVRLGPMTTVADADRVLSSLVAGGYSDARVVID